MGREAKAKRERRHPLNKLMARELRALEAREQTVKAVINTKDFKESIDTRAALLVGTPRELKDNLGVSNLVNEILDDRGIDHEGLMIAAQLRAGRLQLFVNISPNARAACADRAREKLAKRQAMAAMATPAAAEVMA